MADARHGAIRRFERSGEIVQRANYGCQLRLTCCPVLRYVVRSGYTLDRHGYSCEHASQRPEWRPETQTIGVDDQHAIGERCRTDLHMSHQPVMVHSEGVVCCLGRFLIAFPTRLLCAVEHTVPGVTMRPDMQPGSLFPDYELADHTGRKRRLSELQRDDPMILHLSRGHF